MKKRLTAILLSFALTLGLTSFAAAEGGIPTAANFDELTAVIEGGATTVEVTNSISVMGTLGSDEQTITLIRSADFTEGPMLWLETGRSLKNLIVDGGNVETKNKAAVIYGNCTIENVTFQNCTAGAVWITSYLEGTPVFSGCTFKDNSSDTGAHVLNSATATFSDCVFTGGKATNSAGAIRNNGDLTLTDCTFTGNCTNGTSTFQNGGAIYSIRTLYAENCRFTENSSLVGGAIDTIGSSNTELTGCTFTNNSAYAGGGIATSGTTTITDTLIYKNTATNQGSDLDATNPITVSYSTDYIFDETPSGWHSDFYTKRSGDKLFEPSFEGSGEFMFLMESDLPAPEPETDPPVEPTPTPTPPVEPDPEPEPPAITIRPSTKRHTTTVVSKPIKPALDKANMLYLVGYRDAAPDGNITRRQVAHILYNLMSAESQKYYACETSPFVDVEDDTAIAVLAKAKIVLGYDEHYRPDTYLTMGELCAILSRFSELESGTSTFQNIEHHWARDYVNICVASGWLDDSTEIDLNGYVRATDAITIIEKML